MQLCGTFQNSLMKCMSLAQYLLPNKELAWMMGWVIFCGEVKLNKRFRFREVINMLVVEEIYTSPALLCRQSDKTQENFTIFGFYSLSLTTTTTYLYLKETAGSMQVVTKARTKIWSHFLCWSRSKDYIYLSTKLSGYIHWKKTHSHSLF